jgi:hypothetical protein
VKSDLGSDHEIITAFEADPAGTAYPWVNAYSVLVPALSNPTNAIFMNKLALDAKLPIDYGREVYGYDKHTAKIGFSTDQSDGSLDFGILDDSGAPRGIHGLLTFDKSPATQLESATKLAAAFGLDDPTKLPPAPEVGVFSVMTHDVMSSDRSAFRFQTSYFKWTPCMNEFGGKDSLSFDKGDEVGQFLESVNFEPMLVMHDALAKGVFEETSRK